MEPTRAGGASQLHRLFLLTWFQRCDRPVVTNNNVDHHLSSRTLGSLHHQKTSQWDRYLISACFSLNMSDQVLLKALALPKALQDRILCRVAPTENSGNCDILEKKKSFILYLPTVLLRKRHNPAFSLACHLANYHNVPVVVLCAVLDDQHLSKSPLSPTVMNARRLAFTLEALQSCCKKFEEHGAGVAVRVHGPGARTPHHLSLAHHALAVVSDEPFVDPHRNYLCRVVKTCQAAKVPCYTVDGSTTVPPKSKLRLSKVQNVEGDLAFTGAPVQAWRWQKQTDPDREAHVCAVVRDGALNAPELECKLAGDFFRESESSAASDTLLNALPSKWKEAAVQAPGQRPWTVSELLSISDCKEWAMTSWEGADTTVKPCNQTHGSEESATRRWRSFLDSGLKNYAKRRNQIVHPHGVSRVSCYLNLGILSIFDVIHDIWQAKESRSGYSTGCQKFLDEVVKWREGSYVHAFANPGYNAVEVLPAWSRRYLESLGSSNSSGYSFDQLESASTGDAVWDAMQSYLVETGELHNNARMTW